MTASFALVEALADFEQQAGALEAHAFISFLVQETVALDAQEAWQALSCSSDIPAALHAASCSGVQLFKPSRATGMI